MTTVVERSSTEWSEVATELFGYVPPLYRVTLETMLALVPLARAHFEAGNVVTTVKLLNAAPVWVTPSHGVSKEQMLGYVLQALPVMYQSDLDPDFEPSGV